MSPTEIYTLSLHDALPISSLLRSRWRRRCLSEQRHRQFLDRGAGRYARQDRVRNQQCASRIGFGGSIGVLRFLRSDRKSTRLNSSHVSISYAVFCLKKKKK